MRDNANLTTLTNHRFKSTAELIYERLRLVVPVDTTLNMCYMSSLESSRLIRFCCMPRLSVCDSVEVLRETDSCLKKQINNADIQTIII